MKIKLIFLQNGTKKVSETIQVYKIHLKGTFCESCNGLRLTGPSLFKPPLRPKRPCTGYIPLFKMLNESKNTLNISYHKSFQLNLEKY